MTGDDVQPGIRLALVMTDFEADRTVEELLVRRMFKDYRIDGLVIYDWPDRIDRHGWLSDLDIGDVTVAAFDGESALREHMVVVAHNAGSHPQMDFGGGVQPSREYSLNVSNISEVFECDAHGRMQPRRTFFKDQDVEQKNVFYSNIGKFHPFKGGFGYFPYFMMYKNDSDATPSKYGRFYETSYGFRWPRDFVLPQSLKKPAGEVRILVYGGSVAYGVFNSADDSFALRLQRSLTDRATEAGDPLRFRVINMGVPGNTVSEATILHSLYASRLEPDFVIGHLGWNDIASTVACDPLILRDGWVTNVTASRLAQIVWRAQGADDDQTSFNDRYDNPLEQCVEVVLRAVERLAHLVRADGARFVFGVQPGLFSKARLHPIEHRFLRGFVYAKPSAFDDLSRIRSGLLELERQGPGLVGVADTVPFNELIGQVDPDDFLFWDHAHMAPKGEEMVAKHYADVLWRKLTGAGDPAPPAGRAS